MSKKTKKMLALLSLVLGLMLGGAMSVMAAPDWTPGNILIGRNEKNTGWLVGWIPQGNFDYYEYEVVRNNKTVKSGTSSHSLIELKGLSDKKVYAFRARAVLKNAQTGQDEAGAWSAWKAIVPDGKLSGGSSKNKITNDGKLQLKISKVNGASKYVVYISRNPNKGYKRVKTLSRNQAGKIFKISRFKGSKFRDNTKYYIKVITYARVNGRMTKSRGEQIYWIEQRVRYVR